MFDFLSFGAREKRLKAERDAALKQSLADKLAKYDARMDEEDDSEFTLVTIKGQKRLVRKQEITIHDQTAISA